MLSVAILGASEKPDRFANKAMRMLEEHGHQVHLIAPGKSEIDGKKVYKSVKDVPQPFHTLTLYVGPKTSDLLISDILSARPHRVIFNPGTENPKLIEQLEANHIETVQDCTLVMLRSGRFESK